MAVQGVWRELVSEILVNKERCRELLEVVIPHTRLMDQVASTVTDSQALWLQSASLCADRADGRHRQRSH